MAVSGGSRQPPLDLLGLALIAAALLLIVVHFVLDSGDDSDAPSWILFVAIACALGAVVSGGVARTRRRRGE